MHVEKKSIYAFCFHYLLRKKKRKKRRPMSTSLPTSRLVKTYFQAFSKKSKAKYMRAASDNQRNMAHNKATTRKWTKNTHSRINKEYVILKILESVRKIQKYMYLYFTEYTKAFDNV